MSSNTLGRYQIIREIARSNDIVYEAVDPAIGRRVALKELQIPPNLSGAQRRERIERFYREAKAAGSLSHPNIVTIHEVGEDRGRHFIAMEFLDGQSLREVLQVQGVQALAEAVRIAGAVAEALDYAHQHGVIHRDVKPDNVYLLTDGRIKLTDFGIARLMFESNLTVDGQVFGTPSYMSPEQVAGKSIDPRSDIFSLGVMLYEMIAGRKPFPGDSVITITYNIMHAEPAPLPALPPGVQQVVMRALAKDPARRFQTAGEMIAALKQALAAGTPAPRPAPAAHAGRMPPSPAPAAPASQPGGNGGGQPLSSPASATGLFMDALSGLRPEEWWFPHRRRSRFRLSPEMRTWIGGMLVAVAVGLVLVFLVWSTMQAYGEWRNTQRRQEALKRHEAGMTAFQNRLYELAVAEFEAAARIDPESDIGRAARMNGARAAARYARVFQESRNLPQAERWYERAITLDPAYAAGYSFLAVLLMQRGEEGRAEVLLQRAIQIAEARLQQPGLPTEQRMEDQATLDQAQHNYGVLLLNRGERLLRAGRVLEAQQAWESAMRVAPGTQIFQEAQERLQRLPSIPSGRP